MTLAAPASNTPQAPKQAPSEELDVGLVFPFGIGLGIAFVIYASLSPFQDGLLGAIRDLLLERGPTQFPAVWFGGIVAVFVVQKFRKQSPEIRALNHSASGLEYPGTAIRDPEAPEREVASLEAQISQLSGIVARRCRRVLVAYQESNGDFDTAAELAADDSALYGDASNSSFLVFKILISVIPLLGFIGTVLGISDAVGNFTGILSGTADIEQLKEGIGEVTSGLGVAFDTTFLALLVAVPLTLAIAIVERRENRLLLHVDRYVNDRLLRRLKVRDEESQIAPATRQDVGEAVDAAFQSYLPRPEALVEPANTYARQAADQLAETFVARISHVQETTDRLLNQLDELTQTSARQRQDFVSAIEQQQERNQSSLREIIGEIQTGNQQQQQSTQSGLREIIGEIQTGNQQQQQSTQSGLREIIGEIQTGNQQQQQSTQSGLREIIGEIQTSSQQQQEQSRLSLQEIVEAIAASSRALVAEMQSGSTAVASSLQSQAEQLAGQLDRAATSLASRVESLERYAAQVSEIAQLQQSLDRTLRDLQTSGELQRTFEGVRDGLGQLRPVLEALSILAETAPEQRRALVEAIAQQHAQQQQNQALLQELVQTIQSTSTSLVEQIRQSGTSVASGLQSQAEHLAGQLDRAATALSGRVESLERYASQVSEVAQLQQSLNATIDSFEKTGDLRETYASLQGSLEQMRPVLEGLGELTRTAPDQRQEFLAAIDRQQQSNRDALQALVQEIQTASSQLVGEVRDRGSAVAEGLQSQAVQLSEQLERAAGALTNRVESLEQYAAQVSEVEQLEQSLNRTLSAIEQSNQLQETLAGLRDSVAELAPAIAAMKKPRRIRLVEEED